MNRKRVPARFFFHDLNSYFVFTFIFKLFSQQIQMKKEKPVILVTNDDGITAPGLHALVEAVQPLGDVFVVAPDSPQSGMGHAITINNLLRLDKVEMPGDS